LASFREDRAVDAVVVTLSRLGRAGPSEVDVVDPGRANPRELQLRGDGAQVVGVLLDELFHHGALLWRHRRDRETLGLAQQLEFLAGRQHDVARGPILDQCAGALLRVEQREQLAREVLLGPERPQAGVRPLADLGRVGAEERRRRGVDAVADEREVQRYVVALHAPAPRLVLGRLAEHGEPVALRVSVVGLTARALRRVPQHLLQEHDRGGLEVAAGAQRAA
jgi:hypothetical protein